MHSESTTIPSSTLRADNRSRRGTIPIAVQVLLILILGVAVLGALAYDTRLYYGVDIDGQPIYQENPRRRPSPPLRPVSADNACEAAEMHLDHTPQTTSQLQSQYGEAPQLGETGLTNG